MPLLPDCGGSHLTTLYLLYQLNILSFLKVIEARSCPCLVSWTLSGEEREIIEIGLLRTPRVGKGALFVSEEGKSRAGGTPAYHPSYGQIAQMVERWAENPRVGSSILSLATNLTKVCIFTYPSLTFSRAFCSW